MVTTSATLPAKVCIGVLIVLVVWLVVKAIEWLRGDRRGTTSTLDV